MFRRSGAFAVLALALPAVAHGQALSCRAPADFPMPRVSRVDPEEVRRTPVTWYTLALSWSPQHCHRPRAQDRFQCGGAGGRFGFVLHGLWPEGEGRQWPQYCRPASAVPRAVLRQHLCTTPSPELLQHEWERHGSCMTNDPARYFRAGSILYRAIRYPDMAALSRETTLRVADFKRAFAGANRGIRESMIAVETNRGGWLNEVRICLARTFRPMRCPAQQRGAPAGARLRIAPLR